MEKIHFLLLNKDELSYEVQIRGEKPLTTVHELRQQISRLGKIKLSSAIKSSCLTFEDDLKGVTASLIKLGAYMDDLDSEYSDKLYQKSNNLANHIHNRLFRIQSTEDSKGLKQVLQCKNMLDEYKLSLREAKPQSHTDVPPQSTPTHTPSHHNSLSNEEWSLPRATLTQNTPTINVQCNNRSWQDRLGRLRFDGRSCVREFLTSLEEFQLANNISGVDLVRTAHILFVDDALRWFRTIKNQSLTWEEIISRLKDDFDVSGYNDRLMNEIESRKQQPSEPCINYITNMCSLMDKLDDPLREISKLKFILRGIQPQYTTAMLGKQPISSIEELKTFCKTYDEMIVSFRGNILESSQQSNSINSSPYTINNHSNNPVSANNFNKSNFRNSNSNSQNKFNRYNFQKVNGSQSCFKCGAFDHISSKCQFHNSIRCQGCGKRGTDRNNCSSCRNNTKEHSKN